MITAASVAGNLLFYILRDILAAIDDTVLIENNREAFSFSNGLNRILDFLLDRFNQFLLLLLQTLLCLLVVVALLLIAHVG